MTFSCKVMFLLFLTLMSYIETDILRTAQLPLIVTSSQISWLRRTQENGTLTENDNHSILLACTHSVAAPSIQSIGIQAFSYYCSSLIPIDGGFLFLPAPL